jgi:hypothetical protein
MIFLSVGVVGSTWPNVVKTEVLPEGRTRHTLDDGVVLTVEADPTYILEYESRFVGAEPGETFEVRVSLTGRSNAEGTFEAWNFDRSTLRNSPLRKLHELRIFRTGHPSPGKNCVSRWQKTKPIANAALNQIGDALVPA